METDYFLRGTLTASAVKTLDAVVVSSLYLVKQNIRTLLKARGQDQKDLARWCRRTESWISQILTKPDRGFSIKEMDRIADFFGLATYQLFQPGLSHMTERRQGKERRAGADRRLSRVSEMLVPTPSYAELETRVRGLSPEEYRTFARRAMGALELVERGPGGTVQPDQGETTAPPDRPTQRTPGRRR